jgi:hypothetical protein
VLALTLKREKEEAGRAGAGAGGEETERGRESACVTWRLTGARAHV